MRDVLLRFATLVGLGVAAQLVVLGSAIAQPRRGSEPSPATGRLIVICLQESADVFVDDVRVGTVPIEPQTLAVGEHTVRVIRPGFTEFSEVVTIRRGQETQLEVELLAVSTVAHVRSTPPGAQVFLDGAFRGETPIDIDLNEGGHSIRVRRQGYAEQIRSLTASAGSETTLAFSLELLDPDDDPSRVTAEPRSWYERPLVWVVAGAAAAAIAIVVAIVASSSNDASQVDAFCGTPPRCIRIDAP